MTHFTYDSAPPDVPHELYVQNRRASTLFEFAIETARAYRPGESWPGEVERVSTWFKNEFATGLLYSIKELFPNASSRRFWCRAFLDAARAVFDRELGKHDTHFWQARCICDLVTMGKMLFHAAEEIEPGWVGPEPRDWRELDAEGPLPRPIVLIARHSASSTMTSRTVSQRRHLEVE